LWWAQRGLGQNGGSMVGTSIEPVRAIITSCLRLQ
jgi:hypothetical protein